MTLGDLYPDVRLYSEVETIIMTEGGGGGEVGKVGTEGITPHPASPPRSIECLIWKVRQSLVVLLHCVGKHTFVHAHFCTCRNPSLQQV